MLTTEFYNVTTIESDYLARQSRTFQGPLLGLLLAATFLAKASQAKPYLLGYNQYNQSPWVPFRPLYSYFPPLWYSLQGNYLQTTHSPQILPPPLHQQQIIHIHDRKTTTPRASPEDGLNDNHIPKQENEEDESILEPSTEAYDGETQSSKEIQDNEAEPSNQYYKYIKYNGTVNLNSTKDIDQELQETLDDQLDFPDYKEPASRARRGSSRKGSRKPDYDDRVRSRRKPIRRRSTTPVYDEYFDRQVNRRRRRPANRNRIRGNRRPINREPDYYDSDDDYYDDYAFGRQDNDDEDTTESSTTTTLEPSTGSTKGYTYGPPQTGYGPPQTGYGPPQTGYGPPNGNDQISITYAPPSAPGRDVLSPLIDAFYNQYSKNSVLRRLQELLQPNNFYNNQQYDINYQDSF